MHDGVYTLLPPSALCFCYLQRRFVWENDSGDAEPLASGDRCSRERNRLWATPTPAGPQENGNVLPDMTNGDVEIVDGSRSRFSSPDTDGSRPANPDFGSGEGDERGALKSLKRYQATRRDEPAVILGLASLPDNPAGGGECLHGGDGAIWLPGGKTTWCTRKRRPRPCISSNRRREVGYGTKSGDASVFARAPQECGVCLDRNRASVYSVQVSEDGRGILAASKDATVTLWDAQSRAVVYRFGHSRLSTRARPILWDNEDSSPRGWGPRGEVDSSGGRGTVLTGMRDGGMRSWRVGSQFPNRVFKSARRHGGFEVTCLASSRDGSMFASSDSSGNVCVQSATAGGISSLATVR